MIKCLKVIILVMYPKRMADPIKLGKNAKKNNKILKDTLPNIMSK